ncbi:MAG TPA: DUF177 domain-containing protein [Candidatus Limnocylindria bacterium]
MRINVAPLLKQPMGSFDDYSFSESPIDPRGDNAELLEVAIVDVAATIRATHTTPGVYIDGTAAAHLATQCSRCLRPTDAPIHAAFAEQYYATLAVETGAGLTEPPPDALTIGSDFRIDLTELVREELILAAPIASLHAADCRGLCPECGEDLNDRPHEHAPSDGRWAKLAALKDFAEEAD